MFNDTVRYLVCACKHTEEAADEDRKKEILRWRIYAADYVKAFAQPEFKALKSNLPIFCQHNNNQ